MAYNRWISGCYYTGGELKHYGVLGMRWGVRKARYYTKKSNDTRLTEEQRAEYRRKLKSTIESVQQKSKAKLTKYETSYQNRQNKANSGFRAAQKKENSWLKNEVKTEKLYKKASKSQYKANRTLDAEKRWFDHMTKAYKDMGVDMDSDTVKLGEQIVQRVIAQSQSLYAARKRR